MAEPFNIMLAGKVIGIHPLWAEVRDLCADYLTDRTPDFEIETSPENIAFERQKAYREALLEGTTPVVYTDAYLETLSVYRMIADRLLDYDTLLMHGSVIAVDGEAYLFTAKSGTGKSTHTRLWRELFKDRAVMVNDDKPLLKLAENGVLACGTPWDGKHRLSSNICVPLKAICLLERSTDNHIEPVSRSAALPMLIQQSYRPDERDRLTRSLTLLGRLGSSVKLYRLGCNMQAEAAKISYEGMNL